MSRDAQQALLAYEAECRQRGGCPVAAYREVLSKKGASLSLIAQNVADADVEAIAATMHLSNIQEIILREIRLGTQVWHCLLCSCSQLQLTKVVLAGSKLGECDQTVVAHAIGELRAAYVDLSATDLADEFVTALACSPLLAAGGPCHTVNLSNNRVTDAGVATLAQHIAAAGADSALRSLALAYNCITDVGALAIADVLSADGGPQPQARLEHVDLEGNHIGDSGAVALAAAVQQSSRLVSLRFSYNSMESVALSYWGGALRNDALEVLELASSYPKPGTGVAAVLEAACRSERLRLLDVRGALLDDGGVRAACELIASDCPLQILRLSVADAEGGHAIAQAVATRGAPVDVALTGPVDQADMLRLKQARFGGGSARGTPLALSSRGTTTSDGTPELRERVGPARAGARATTARSWRDGGAEPAFLPLMPLSVSASHDRSDAVSDASGRWPAQRSFFDGSAHATTPAHGGERGGFQSLAGSQDAARGWLDESVKQRSDRALGPQLRAPRCRSADTPPVAAIRTRSAPSSPHADGSDCQAPAGDSITPSLKPRLHCTKPRAFALAGGDDPLRPGRLAGLSSGGGAERAALAFLKADEECKGKIGRQHVARALQELGLFDGLEPKQLGRVLEKDAKLANPSNDGTFTFPEFLVCFERLERWHAQQQRQGRIQAHSGWAQAEVPAGWASNATLRKSFRNFCTHGKSRADKAIAQLADLRMSSQQWAKLCRDSRLLEPDGPLPVFAIDVIFVTCKPASQRHLQYNTFLDALAIVAKEANMTFEEVASKLGCRGDASESARPSNGGDAGAASCRSSHNSFSVRSERGAAARAQEPAQRGVDVVALAAEQVLRVVEARDSALADRLQQMEELLGAGKENSRPAGQSQGQGKDANIVAAVRAEMTAFKAEMLEVFAVMHQSAAARSAAAAGAPNEVQELKRQLEAQQETVAKLQQLLEKTRADVNTSSKGVAELQRQARSSKNGAAVERCLERQGRLEGAIMQVASRVDMLDTTIKQGAR